MSVAAPSRWTIKRNCSAAPGQLALVFASIVAVSFVIGVGFAAYGLWLVLPFVGIELLAVAFAFLCYGRHAADHEHIELNSGWLAIRRVDGTQQSQWRFAAPWVRIEQDRSRVFVAAHGQRVEVGRHLRSTRRAVLADELKLALRTAVA